MPRTLPLLVSLLVLVTVPAVAQEAAMASAASELTVLDVGLSEQLQTDEEAVAALLVAGDRAHLLVRSADLDPLHTMLRFRQVDSRDRVLSETTFTLPVGWSSNPQVLIPVRFEGSSEQSRLFLEEVPESWSAPISRLPKSGNGSQCETFCMNCSERAQQLCVAGVQSYSCSCDPLTCSFTCFPPPP